MESIKGGAIMKITIIIKTLIEEWEKSPYDINDGDCENFAMEVIKRMGGYSKDISEVCTQNFQDLGGLDLGHVWILYKGKHYDAQCPNGIKNWFDLPIFGGQDCKRQQRGYKRKIY